jgi:hypothetical protein
MTEQAAEKLFAGRGNSGTAFNAHAARQMK